MSPGNPTISRITPTANFPEVLYSMIVYCEREGYNDVISFFSHGRAFAIHRPRRFEKELMPRFFFNMGKIASFHRQLNLYGFKRITEGPDNGGYWHRKFLRGRRDMLVTLKRKSTSKVKRLAQEQEEKNLEEINPLEFNNMPPISPCPGYADAVVNEGLPLTTTTNIVGHHHHHHHRAAAAAAYLPGSLLASDLNLNLGNAAAARSVQDASVASTSGGAAPHHHLLQMVQQQQQQQQQQRNNNPPTSSSAAAMTTHHHSAADFGTSAASAQAGAVGASTLLEAQAILERRELMLRQAEEARNHALANELHSYQAAQIMAASAASAPTRRVLKIAASDHHHPHHHHHHNGGGGLIATTTTATAHPSLADYADLNGVLTTSQHRVPSHPHRTTTTTTAALPQLITTTHHAAAAAHAHAHPSTTSATNNARAAAQAAAAHALSIQEAAANSTTASYLRDIHISSLQNVHAAQQKLQQQQQHQQQQQLNIARSSVAGVGHHPLQPVRGLESVVAPGPAPQQHHIILTNAAAAATTAAAPHSHTHQLPGSPASRTVARSTNAAAAAAAAAMDSQTRALLNLQAVAAAGVGHAASQAPSSAYAAADATTRAAAAAGAPVSSAVADRSSAVGRSYFARFAGGRRSI